MPAAPRLTWTEAVDVSVAAALDHLRPQSERAAAEAAVAALVVRSLAPALRALATSPRRFADFDLRDAEQAAAAGVVLALRDLQRRSGEVAHPAQWMRTRALRAARDAAREPSDVLPPRTTARRRLAEGRPYAPQPRVAWEDAERAEEMGRASAM